TCRQQFGRERGQQQEPGEGEMNFFFSSEGDGHHHRVAVRNNRLQGGNGEADGSKNKVHQRIKVSTAT
ncbi:Uncharacterized protein APZ42_002371, partial [Daphnia magna]